MKTIPNEPAMPIKDVGVKVYNGGPDFHISGDLGQADFNTNFGGLTKREHFATMAMQGMCANPHIGDEKPEDIARFAVEQADAFIEALNKEKP